MANLLGSEVRLHVIYMGEINEDKLQRKGIRTYQYDGVLTGNWWTRYIGFTKFITDVLRYQDIDIVQNIWMHFALFPLKVAGLIANVPVVARVAGVPISNAETNDPLKWMRNRLGLAIERASLALADHIQVLSKSLRNTFSRRGISPKRMSVISQGCDTKAFAPSSSGDPSGEAGYTEDESTSVGCQLLYVGRITPRKGLDELIEAFREVVETAARDVILDLIGEGPSDVVEKYRSKLKQWGVAEKVRLRGYVKHNRLRRIYQECDIFILPSHREGLPNVMMEAMASGAACIGTSVGAIPELLDDNRGIVVPPRRPDRLASAILHLIQDCERTDAMTQRARDYIVQHHSFCHVRKDYREMYLRVGNSYDGII
ncbi:glycosyltransferase family 4 protein [Salinibacter ruber]|uniref:Glycosyltransferase involved in cell wall biosynthesis n=1 Tax=Salinibacter ruber TaxID=146919 RepID=A0A9X2V5D2_9BACT|nr:glycosyltransferase family 4 protein [Salinibacter ruber]MCS4121626.1 glycosyltransferase involved in cell wall biosynthesis [Salinibacter ruber]